MDSIKPRDHITIHTIEPPADLLRRLDAAEATIAVLERKIELLIGHQAQLLRRQSELLAAHTPTQTDNANGLLFVHRAAT